MRRSIGYLAAWAVVTAVAVGLSWLGIRSAMAPSPAAFEPAAAPEQSAVLPQPTVTSVSVALPTAPTTTQSVTPSSTRPPVARTTTPTLSTTDGPPTSAQLPAGEWQPDGSYVHAFHLRGGHVVARYRPAGVQALSAVPEDGWSVAVEPPGGPLVVNFRGAGGRLSRLEATWSEAGPTAKVIEK